MKKVIHTDNAPEAIGTYSQAIQVDNTVYLSGQIPLDPRTMLIISDDIKLQIRKVFENLAAVLAAAGATFSDVVKLNIYLTELEHFSTVNEIMAEFFQAPFPARAAIGVKQLPRDARVEMDAIAVLDKSE